MPGIKPEIARRLSFPKGNPLAPPPPLTPAEIVKNDACLSTRTKTRVHGPQGSRRASLLKRTTSVPATTFHAITKTTKSVRHFACVSTGKVPRPPMPSSSTWAPPPSLESSPFIPGAPVPTTFLTAVSICPSTRAILSNNADGAEGCCPPAAQKYMAALTPCASVRGICSGMMGGFGDLNNSSMENGRFQGSRIVSIGQHQPWWSLLMRRLIFWDLCQLEVKSIGGFKEVQGHAGQIPPWLTMFQIAVIMLLTVTLYRNMESLFGW